MMTERDRLHLSYLQNATQPLWGGHLKRKEPITDPDMQRWIDAGWIVAVGEKGYIATEKCRAALSSGNSQ